MSQQPIAVHFGAGNIGRGLIGARLQEAGYFVVFADVNQELIDQLNEAGSYAITELGDTQNKTTYDSFRALHSQADSAELIDFISRAEIITASVGVGTLNRIAPLIEAGLLKHTGDGPAVVMACENAINASDILHSFIQDKKAISKRAVFLNTAVDRIIPIQRSESPVDVWVESFSEWVIDVSRLGSTLPIPGTVQVENLDPYIERKLFTVNTSHLAAAYFGQRAGHETIVSALSDAEVFEATRRALDETSAVIRARHGVSAEDQQRYVAKTLERISNPAIDDYVVRVGREPLRKLSRNERLIGPAAYFAEHIGEPAALLAVVDAAMSFRSAEDKQVVELQQLLTQHEPIELAQTVCGIEQEHPLAPSLIRLFDLHKSAVSRKS